MPMTKIYVLLLIMMLPLQSLWAAVELYHVHDSGHASSLQAVGHSHGNHDHSSTSADTQSRQDNAGKSTCDADHHHCHAHSASVLPSLLTIEMLPHALDQESDQFTGFQSFSSNRIERPKWA
ncbi:MAG: hypothetical protein V7542_12005 [Limnobacter sp.]|uniref:hypothetical protein n=2 Tax=Limnobacter TaxID=131079 RepID=UPI000D453AA3|nr:hypothetical protein [Limnobacter sp. SAORIC-690]PQJ24431.1 hypothetical protein BSZ31_05075 [Limnobacter sp. SAORIC-690]